jgi:hypothetical protein
MRSRNSQASPLLRFCHRQAEVLIGSAIAFFSTLLIQAQSPSWIPAAKQDPVLREHFNPVCFQTGVGSKRIQHQNRSIDIPSTGPTNPEFFQQCIDQQIERYIKQLRESLEKLKGNFQEVRSAQKNCSSGGKDGKKQLRQTLDRLRKDSKDLYRNLKGIYTFLRSKDEFRATVGKDSEASCFRLETEYMGGQILLAEREIQKYFSGTKVVSVRKMDTNMLMPLYHTKEMAKALIEAM